LRQKGSPSAGCNPPMVKEDGAVQAENALSPA
jgi:hypothetical protein